MGRQGSAIHTRDGAITIPCATPKAVVDPTGCGDAYRAGILHGLLKGLDWETTGRVASLMGAIKIETRGSAEPLVHADEFAQRLDSALARGLRLKRPSHDQPGRDGCGSDHHPPLR